MKPYIPALMLLSFSLLFFILGNERAWVAYSVLAIADAYITFKIIMLTKKEARNGK